MKDNDKAIYRAIRATIQTLKEGQLKELMMLEESLGHASAQLGTSAQAACNGQIIDTTKAIVESMSEYDKRHFIKVINPA